LEVAFEGSAKASTPLRAVRTIVLATAQLDQKISPVLS
jgi:hypothetical protein